MRSGLLLRHSSYHMHERLDGRPTYARPTLASQAYNKCKTSFIGELSHKEGNKREESRGRRPPALLLKGGEEEIPARCPDTDRLP